MKIIKTQPLKNGKLRTVVESDADETLLAVRQGCFYRMGEPMHEDVLPDHVIEGLQRVAWCPIEQRWVDAA